MKKIFLSLIVIVTLIGSFSFLAARPTYAFDPICDLGGALLPPVALGCDANSVIQTGQDLLSKTPLEIVSNILTGIVEWVMSAIAGPKVYPTKLHAGIDDSVAARQGDYGMLGIMSAGMAQMYQPPVTMQDYLATIHPIGQAYAQSCTQQQQQNQQCVPTTRDDIYGNVITNFWTASRNIAYAFFTIIIVVIGLMLMFRSKIDPRTTVTVTAALPGLIISLVLITFSLTFAALIINFGQLLEEIIKNIMTHAIVSPAPLLCSNPNGTLVFGGCLDSATGLNATDLFLQFVNPFAGSGNAYISFGGQGLTQFSLGALILSLVLLVFSFILTIQIFFMLLVKFVYLMVKPIAAPFIFLFGGLPGRGGISWTWVRGYAADVLTFPLVLLLINLGVAIKNGGSGVGTQGDPFGMFPGSTNIAPLVVLGLLFICTKVPAFLEEILQATESAYVGRKGADISGLAKRVPIIGGMMK